MIIRLRTPIIPDLTAGDCPVCVQLAAMPWRERYIADDRISHCRDCHAIWSRKSRQQHCTKCHRTFSTISSADRAHGTYRDGERELHRRCHDPADRGMAVTVNRWGTEVWRGPDSARNGRRSLRQRLSESRGGS